LSGNENRIGRDERKVVVELDEKRKERDGVGEVSVSLELGGEVRLKEERNGVGYL
jgi:hypothetical protein